MQCVKTPRRPPLARRHGAPRQEAAAASRASGRRPRRRPGRPASGRAADCGAQGGGPGQVQQARPMPLRVAALPWRLPRRPPTPAARRAPPSQTQHFGCVARMRCSVETVARDIAALAQTCRWVCLQCCRHCSCTAGRPHVAPHTHQAQQEYREFREREREEAQGAGRQPVVAEWVAAAGCPRLLALPSRGRPAWGPRSFACPAAGEAAAQPAFPRPRLRSNQMQVGRSGCLLHGACCTSAAALLLRRLGCLVGCEQEAGCPSAASTFHSSLPRLPGGGRGPNLRGAGVPGGLAACQAALPGLPCSRRL